MSFLKTIILIFIIIVSTPIVSYLAMKFGTFGMYRGKEARGKKLKNNTDDDTVEVTTMRDSKRKYRHKFGSN